MHLIIFKLVRKIFGELVQESLAKTNSSTWSNVSLADSQNGLYNEEKAKEVFAKAKASLQAEGVELPNFTWMPWLSKNQQRL